MRDYNPSTGDMCPQPLDLGRALLFLHIRKTGGTTVRSWLENRFSVTDALLDWHYEQRRESSPAGYHFVTGHCGFDVVSRFDAPPDVLVFFREPLQRALSAFYFFQSASPELLRIFHATLSRDVATERERFAQRAQELGIVRFLKAEESLARRWLFNVQTRALAGAAETDPVGTLHEDRCLSQALSNLERCDVIGLTERVDESLALLCRRRGWPAPGVVPAHNRGRHRPHAANVPDEAIDILTQWNRLDAELYRAAAERFDAQSAERPHDVETGPSVALLPSANGFRFDQPIIGEGWHARERHGDRWLAWSGPQRESTLFLRATHAPNARLEIQIEHALAPDVLEGLQIDIGDVRIPWFAFERDGSRWVAATVPDSGQRGGDDVLKLRLTVPRTIRPAELNPGCGDDRALGIALSQIELRPPS